jgi:hypothetical protein
MIGPKPARRDGTHDFGGGKNARPGWLQTPKRPDRNEHLDTATQAAWQYLQSQWDTAYQFGYEPAHETPFNAKRKDNGLTLQARTAESLQALVRKDYAERPVPRQATS